MKLPALALLLLLAVPLCARGAEGAALPAPDEEPPAAAAAAGSAAQLEAQVEAAFDALELHLQALSDYVGKELPGRLQAEHVKQQAKAYLEQAGQHLAPLATQLRSDVFGFFSRLLGPAKEEAAQA